MKILKYNLLTILFLFLLSCEDNELNKGSLGNIYSIKVEKNFKINNFSYGWYIIESPLKSNINSTDLFIKNSGKEMSFKPDVPGNYIFELIVFNKNGKSIKKNIYEFNIDLSSNTKINAEKTINLNENKTQNINNKLTQLEKETSSNKKIITQKNNEIVKKPIKKKSKPPKKLLSKANQIKSLNGNYTIQIFSEKISKNAENKMHELKNMGLDSYIQKAYFEKDDQLWYRVRVGNFISKKEANYAAIEISKLTNLKTWVDKVRVE